MKLLNIKFDSTKLKPVRMQLGISQTEVAKQVGVKKQTLYSYENGKGNPSADILARLFALYGIQDLADFTVEQS